MHQHLNYRVPEEEEKKKGYEKIFEEIIVENFPNMEKEIVNQAQEAQRVPYRINPRRNTSRYILIKLTKTKHKERILKAAREKQQVTYKGNPIHLTVDLFFFPFIFISRRLITLQYCSGFCHTLT